MYPVWGIEASVESGGKGTKKLAQSQGHKREEGRANKREKKRKQCGMSISLCIHPEGTVRKDKGQRLTSNQQRAEKKKKTMTSSRRTLFIPTSTPTPKGVAPHQNVNGPIPSLHASQHVSTLTTMIHSH